MTVEEGLESSATTIGGRTDSSALLVVEKVSKSFGHVQALKGVSFDVGAGEVVGLLGDNGAGKSTIIKILSGVYQPDEGTIRRDGLPVQLNDPSSAGHHGIATVFQDLRLVETRSVAHNIFLGREPRRARVFLDRKRMELGTEDLLRRMRVRLPSVRVDVEVLSGGQRQAVAITRALAQGGEVLLLDEPTAALGVKQTEQVYELIDEMRTQGKGVMLVTHDLADVLHRTDRVVVFRQGSVWAITRSDETDNAQLVGWLTGALPRQDGLE